MIDITKPLRFRDEADKREVRHVGEMPNGQLVFAVLDIDGDWIHIGRHKDGRFQRGRDSSRDIINVPETRGQRTKPWRTSKPRSTT